MNISTVDCREQEWQCYLVCCSAVITNEVNQGLTPNQISLSYAMAIVSDHAGTDKPNWPQINQAILDKWGQNGLNRVKKLAWHRIDEKVKKFRQPDVDHPLPEKNLF